MPEAETTTTRSTQNPSVDDIDSNRHPLYLHHSDHPGMILVSKKLVGSENYSTWKRSIMIALSAKNKLKLINGELPEPESKSELKPLWERANDMVISWILNTVSDQISTNLTYVNSAFALWNELHDHYAQIDGHRFKSQMKLFNINNSTVV